MNDQYIKQTSYHHVPFHLPKLADFNAPEGQFPAAVYKVFQKKDGKLRINWKLLSPATTLSDFIVGKDYAPDDPALTEDLINWLGLEGVNKILKPDGSMDLGKLNGLKADLKVVHIHNEGREHPYVWVAKIAPLGTLTSELEVEA